jgi:hypothetical protein
LAREGVGYITQNRTDKEKRINEFVAKILAHFRRNNKKQLLKRNGLPYVGFFYTHYDITRRHHITDDIKLLVDTFYTKIQKRRLYRPNI